MEIFKRKNVFKKNKRKKECFQSMGNKIRDGFRSDLEKGRINFGQRQPDSERLDRCLGMMSTLWEHLDLCVCQPVFITLKETKKRNFV